MGGLITDLDAVGFVANVQQLDEVLFHDLLACLTQDRLPTPGEAFVAFQLGAVAALNGVAVDTIVNVLDGVLREQLDDYARMIWAVLGSVARFADEGDACEFLRRRWGTRLDRVVEAYCDTAIAGHHATMLTMLMTLAGTLDAAALQTLSSGA